MAQSPKFKVFDADGNYQASCKEIEAAAALMSLYSNGATIRIDHSPKWTVWTEGTDGWASESYDVVGMKTYENEVKLQRAAMAKRTGVYA